MARLRLVTVTTLAIILLCGTPAAAIAESVACGDVHADGYRPVVSDCGDWLVVRHPARPVLKEGRWVIEDDGHELTLMYNAGATDWASKDMAILFFQRRGIDVRFGAAQPMDGTEPSQEYLDQHIGLYVESEYAGEWIAAGIPHGR